MAERVAQLAAFVNRPRRRRRNMAWKSRRGRELLEQLLHAGFVLADVRINLTPGAFEVDVATRAAPPCPGPATLEHIQVVLLDDPVQVHVDEVLPRHRAQLPDHQRLHVG